MVYGAERVLIPGNNIGKLKQKKITITVLCLLMVCALPLGGLVIVKAPLITAIEEDFAASYIAGDVQGLMTLKRGIDAINDMPVDYAIENIPLQTNFLPIVTATYTDQ
jgi:hypothetical protein